MGVKAGCRRPESARTVRELQSAEIGKTSILEARFRIFRWTLCSGHTWDVLLMPTWRKVGRRWLGCVGHLNFEECLWDLHGLG